LVEIIAYAPTAFYHCTHCEVVFNETGALDKAHQEQLQNSLPPDLKQDYQQLSDWVQEVTQKYCDRVAIRVIDAASIEGFIKSLRYRVRRYPALIVDRQTRFPGGAFAAADLEIARSLEKELTLEP
jgi:hypothetical protein